MQYYSSCFYYQYIVKEYKLDKILLLGLFLTSVIAVLLFLFVDVFGFWIFALLFYILFVFYAYLKFKIKLDVDYKSVSVDRLVDAELISILLLAGTTGLTLSELAHNEDVKSLLAKLEVDKLAFDKNVDILKSFFGVEKFVRDASVPVSPLLVFYFFIKDDEDFKKMLFSVGATANDLDRAFATVLLHKYQKQGEDLVTPIGFDFSNPYLKYLDAHGQLINFNKKSIVVFRSLVTKVLETILTTQRQALVTGTFDELKDFLYQDIISLLQANKKFRVNVRLYKIDGSMFGKNQEDVNVLQGILYEVYKSNNIILIIENFEQLFASKDLSVAIRNTILPALKTGIKIIALTSDRGYQQYIERDAEITASFTRLIPERFTDEEIIDVLDREARALSIHVSYLALREIVNKCKRYIPSKIEPQRSLFILEDIAHNGSVTKNVVDKYFDNKFASTSLSENKEKDLLLHFEQVLSTQVVGQARAVSALSKSLRIARANMASDHKPLGSFFFVGPTGVGKTESCKVLASSYFGGDDKLVRFDMSEYSGEDGLQKLIGGLSGSGLLTESVRRVPGGVYLFDEFEKASKPVQDLFLQILDEGSIKDGFGENVYFYNIFVVCTSNAASDQIVKIQDMQAEKIVSLLHESGGLRTELLNRFDSVVVFDPLSKDSVKYIAKIIIDDMAEALRLDGYELVVSDEVLSLLASLGYSETLGARPLKRLIKDTIQDYIASAKLSGSIKPGDKIIIDPKIIHK